MAYALKGVDVIVKRPMQAPTDPFGAPVPGTSPGEPVGNVIVDSPSDADIESTTRQYGASCDLVLHFPKSFTGSLRGCSVELPAPWSDKFEVMGDPMPYDPSLTPGAHNRPVHVRRVVG